MLGKPEIIDVSDLTSPCFISLLALNCGVLNQSVCVVYGVVHKTSSRREGGNPIMTSSRKTLFSYDFFKSQLVFVEFPYQ
jgi:hypothetical protein